MTLKTRISAVTYARMTQGADEAPLLSAWCDQGVIVTNFDDQTYVLPNWTGSLRLVRRIVRRSAVKQLELRLIAAITRLRPELFFAFKGTFVTEATLRVAKDVGAVCALYYPDMSFAAPGRDFVQTLRSYDMIFSNKSFGPLELKRLGVRTVCRYVPLWYEPTPSINGNVSLNMPVPDILFVGHYSPKKAEYLKAVSSGLCPEYSLLIVGESWGGKGVDEYWFGCGLYGHVVGVLYQRAKVTLGLLSERPASGIADDQITSRTFTVPGAGGFLLHERTKDFHDLFGDYPAVFDGPADLVAQCRHYLKDDGARDRLRAQMKTTLNTLQRDSASAGMLMLNELGFR